MKYTLILQMFLAFYLFSQPAIGNIIDLESELGIDSDSDKVEIEIDNLDLTKSDGTKIKADKVRYKRKKSKKGGKVKVKGKLDPMKKSGNLNMKMDLSGSHMTDILVSIGGTEIEKNFGEIFFTTSWEADMTFDGGVITSFTSNGAVISLPTFDFPEFDFTTGIANFSLFDSDFVTSLVFDILPFIKPGELASFDVQSQTLLEFENIEQPFVFAENSSNRVFFISSPQVWQLLLFASVLIYAKSVKTKFGSKRTNTGP